MGVVDSFNISVSKSWVLKSIDCFEDSPVYEEVSRTYDTVINQVKDIVSPKAVYKFDKKPNDLVFDTLKDCSHVVYCALTLGDKISRKSSELFENGEYLEGMLIDAIADELLHSISLQLYKTIYQEAKILRLGLTFRISPEGGEMPLEYNRNIIESLGAEKTLNLTFTSQYMLNPIKSLCFIYGAGSELSLPVTDNYCLTCSDTSCKRRRENYVNIKVIDGSSDKVIKAPTKKSILDSLVQNKIQITSPCGGKGTCGKCKIQITEGRTSTQGELRKFNTEDQINEDFTLACMTYPLEDCTIKIASLKENSFEILEEYESMNCIAKSKFTVKEVFMTLSGVEEQKSLTKVINDQLNKEYLFTLKALKKLSTIINKKSNDITTLCSSKKLNVVINEDRIEDIYEAGSEKVFGIGVDIGTTTIAFNLVDLLNGNIISSYSLVNSQRQYGADVISRIRYSSEGLHILTECLREDILNGINNLCSKVKVSFNNIYSIVAAGNSTMVHLLLGLNCESLAQAPFTTITTSLLKMCSSELFGNSLLNCEVTILPSVSAYVGADIVSGMLKCGFHNLDGVSLLIDIGTNGEMAIGDNKRILCVSTAAGPAFEGANITHGTGSIRGAISAAEINDGQIKYTTIGNDEPVGICGTGIIDIVAGCIKNAIVDETGRFDEERFVNGYIEIARNSDNEPIILNQKDIREIQLAKSAIRSGIEILIKEFGCKYEDIKNVYLAGGFGNKINIKSSIDIGLIPEKLKEKIKSIGNTSLGGTIEYLLNNDSSKAIEDILSRTTYTELSIHKEFNDLFIENMMF